MCMAMVSKWKTIYRRAKTVDFESSISHTHFHWTNYFILHSIWRMCRGFRFPTMTVHHTQLRAHISRTHATGVQLRKLKNCPTDLYSNQYGEKFHRCRTWSHDFPQSHTIIPIHCSHPLKPVGNIRIFDMALYVPKHLAIRLSAMYLCRHKMWAHSELDDLLYTTHI